MVDVNVSEHIVFHLVTSSEVLLVLNVLSIFAVPVLNLGSNLGIDVSFLVDVVHPLIKVDDDVE